MGFRDGAANGLRSRLENVGVRSELAYAIGQVAYLPPRKIPHWVAEPIISKPEVTWLVSQYEKELRDIPPGLACIAVIKGLCSRIFGTEGERMFVRAYPEYSEEHWAETIAEELGVVAPDLEIAPQLDTSKFSEGLLGSDLYWDGEEWVSATEAGPGTEEESRDAAQTNVTVAHRLAIHCRESFTTQPLSSIREGMREYSMACQVKGESGRDIEGFLVISDGRLGFFSREALFAPGGSNFAPLFFDTTDIAEVFCVLDECLEPLSRKLENIRHFERSGQFTLAIKLDDGGGYFFNILPENVLTDVHRSRLGSTYRFLRILDAELDSPSKIISDWQAAGYS